MGGDLNHKLEGTTRNRSSNYFKNLLGQYTFYFLNRSLKRGKNFLNNVFINNRNAKF